MKFSSKVVFSFIFFLILFINLSQALGNAVNVTNESTFDHLIIPSNEVRYFNPFDINSSTITSDYSSYNNDGTLVNTTYSSLGYIDGTFQFDGTTSEINIPYSQNVNFSSPFSISLWFNATTLTTGRTLISEWSGTGSNFRLFQNTNTALRFQITEAGGTSRTVTSSTSFQVGRWYHIVAIANQSIIYLYVNGVLEATNNVNGIRRNAVNLTIGGDSVAGTGDNWAGFIDNVLITNTSLTQTQITQLYQSSYSLFYPTGTDVYNNVNFGDSRLTNLNVSLSCQTFNATRLGFQAGWSNGLSYTYGSEVNFTNCNVNNYVLGGSATNISLKYIYYSNPTSSYSPIISNATYRLWGDTINPNATLISPENNLYTNVTSINLTVNATDNQGLSNITLYVYNGAVLINQTTTQVSGQSGFFGTIFNFLFDGVFNWFYTVTDTIGNVFTTSNRTLTIDTTYPQINILSPTNQYYDYQINNITFILNETNIANCSFGNGSVFVNISCSAVHLVNSIENNNSWTIKATDLVGQSYSRQVNFTQDTIYPQISFGANTPTDASTLLASHFLVNVSLVESNVQSITYQLYNESGLYSDVSFGSGITQVLYTNLPDGNYTFNVSVIDQTGKTNQTQTRTITIYTPDVDVSLFSPRRPRYYFNESVNSVLIYDSVEALNNSYFLWGYPNGSTVLRPALLTAQSDNFNDSSRWSLDTSQVNSSQTCYAVIGNGTAITHLSGVGTPIDTTNCMIKDGAIAHNFELTIDYNITQLTSDSATMLYLTDSETMVDSHQFVYMSMGNWLGYPRGLDVYVDDGNYSGYFVNSLPNSQTVGKFKVVRVENNFSFYHYNGTEFEFLHSGVYNGMRSVLNLYLGVDSANTYGSGTVEWSNLNITSDDVHRYSKIYDTSQGGHYNVTAYASNTLGFYNYSQTRHFVIGDINYPPTTPVINHPEPLDTYGREMDIAWDISTDPNDDQLNYNITLLNADGSFVLDIVGNYGDDTTSSFDWMIPDLAFGNYSLNLTVFENETIEQNSRTYSLLPFYFIINQIPPTTSIVSPLTANYTTNLLLLNVSVGNGHNVSYTIGNGFIEYTNETYVTFPQGLTLLQVCADVELGMEEEYGNYICLNESIYVDSVAPVISFVSPTLADNKITSYNRIDVNMTFTDLSFKNATIRLYNSSGIIATAFNIVNPYYVQFLNVSNGVYTYNVTACDYDNNCRNSQTRTITIDQSLGRRFGISMVLTQYPYVEQNVSYPIGVRLTYDGNIVVDDGSANIVFTEPNGSISTIPLYYNPTTQNYESTIIFSELGTYPFQINGYVQNLSTNSTGQYNVAEAFETTFRLFSDKEGTKYENNFAYVTVEYADKYENANLEAFFMPIADISQIKPVFHAPLINGEATVKLYGNDTYQVRLIDGNINFPLSYSKPDVISSYGTNVYLGKMEINNSQTIDMYLSRKDLHPYFWLFNVLFIVALIFVVLISIGLLFLVPQFPILAIAFVIVGIFGSFIVRLAIWLYSGN